MMSEIERLVELEMEIQLLEEVIAAHQHLTEWSLWLIEARRQLDILQNFPLRAKPFVTCELISDSKRLRQIAQMLDEFTQEMERDFVPLPLGNRAEYIH